MLDLRTNADRERTQRRACDQVEDREPAAVAAKPSLLYFPRVGKIANVQALRGAAAVAVVAYHAATRTGGDFTIGIAGVEVFFVISGFILARTISRPGPFLLRRFLRIYPLYLIVTLASLASAIAFPSLSAANPDVLRSLFLIPTPSGERILVVAWTLSHELFFYTLLASFPRRYALKGTGIVITILAAIGFAFAPAGELACVVTSPLNLCFVAGMLIAKLPQHKHTGTACAVAAIWFAVLHATGYDAGLPGRAFWLGVPSVLVVYGAIGISYRSPTLERWGDASYSLYLVHIPAMKGCAVLFAMMGLGVPGIAVLIPTSLVAGLAAHLWLERPLTHAAQRLRRDRPGEHQICLQRGAA